MNIIYSVISALLCIALGYFMHKWGYNQGSKHGYNQGWYEGHETGFQRGEGFGQDQGIHMCLKELEQEEGFGAKKFSDEEMKVVERIREDILETVKNGTGKKLGKKGEILRR